MAATYLTNRSSTSALDNKTPFEAWFGRKPDLSNSKTFVHVPVSVRTKWDSRNVERIMVGYDVFGYRLFDASSHKVTSARNVIFNESPLQTVNTHIIDDQTPQQHESPSIVSTDIKTLIFSPKPSSSIEVSTPSAESHHGKAGENSDSETSEDGNFNIPSGSIPPFHPKQVRTIIVFLYV